MSQVDKAVLSPPSAKRPLSKMFWSVNGVALSTALPLCMAVGPVQAQVLIQGGDLPPAPSNELDPDFRCYLNDDFIEVCPLTENATTATISLDDTTLLEISGVNENCTEQGDIYLYYDPIAAYSTKYGVGLYGSATCGDFDNNPGIEPGDSMQLRPFEEAGYPDSFSKSSPMLGIYLTSVNAYSRGPFDCVPEKGSVFVIEADEGNEQGNILFLDWSADTTLDEFGNCEFDQYGGQTIYVGFSDTPVDVENIVVTVDSDSLEAQYGGGVYVAGIDYQTILIPEDDLVFPQRGIKTSTTLPPGTDVPPIVADRYTIRDPRPACQNGGPGATSLPAVANYPLVLDGNYDGTDAAIEIYSNDVGELEVIEEADDFNLKVRGTGSQPEAGDLFFTISEYACGVPRGPDPEDTSPDPQPSPRGLVAERVPGGNWAPYIDVLNLAYSLDPVDVLVSFEASGLNGTDFACVDNLASGASTVDQPFFEINARNDEIKYLFGANPTTAAIDPVGRDIMVGCGSKRAFSRRYSFLAYNVIHAPQLTGADLREKTSREITTLSDTVSRVAGTCVEPAFYYSYLRNGPAKIKRYFDLAVRYADSRPSTAQSLFLRAALEAERMQAGLESPAASGGLGACFVGGTDLDDVTANTGDTPYNAFGDLVSQLAHLSYVLRSFRVEMSD